MKSLKEKAVGAVLVVIVLYAAAVGMWFLSAESAWKHAAKTYNDAQQKYLREERLIAKTDYWKKQYEAEKAKMPTFATAKATDTDTTWLGKMDAIAAKHNIDIANRQSGKVNEAGDVLELPITVSRWDGSLKSLVEFLTDLQTTTEGMFDVSEISVSPKGGKKGYLSGSFTLTCAFMREDDKKSAPKAADKRK